MYNKPQQLDPTGQQRVEQGQQSQGSHVAMDLGMYPFTEQYLFEQAAARAEQAKQAAEVKAVPTKENPGTAINQGTPIPQMPSEMNFSMADLQAKPPVAPEEQYQLATPRSDINMGLLTSLQTQAETVLVGTRPQAGSTLDTIAKQKDALIGNVGIDMNQLLPGFGDQTLNLIFGANNDRQAKQREEADRVRRQIREHSNTARTILETADWSAAQQLQSTQMQETQQVVQQAEQLNQASSFLSKLARMKPRQRLQELRGAEGPARQAVEAYQKRQEQRQLKVAPGKAARDTSQDAERRAGAGAKGFGKVG